VRKEEEEREMKTNQWSESTQQALKSKPTLSFNL